MRKISDKDWRFLIQAVVFALLVLAFIHEFLPHMKSAEQNNNVVSRAEIENMVLSARDISAQEIVHLINNSKKPTILFIYTSWCGYCRKTMPHINSLWKEKIFDEMQLIILSADEKLSPLAEYILKNQLQEMIRTPLVINKENNFLLRDLLRQSGASYSGGIPYIGIFAAGGKFMNEIAHFADERTIRKLLP